MLTMMIPVADRALTRFPIIRRRAPITNSMILNGVNAFFTRMSVYVRLVLTSESLTRP